MTAATNDIPRPSAVAFWSFNALVWFGYATLLMIPWLGRFPVHLMLPNKVLIAGTGIAITGALRALYSRLNVAAISTRRLLLLMVAASVAFAVAFDVIVLTVTQGPSAIALRWDGLFGSIDSGIPVMGRAGQYAMVLLAWSLGLHLFEHRGEQRRSDVSVARSLSTDAALTVAGSTIKARDGNRVILADCHEVQWIGADGDYIRIHASGKPLLIRATMKHAAGILEPLGFVRVHRSAIVNPAHVREVVRERPGELVVVLRNGTRVKSGRNYAPNLAHLLNAPSVSAE